MSSEFTQVAIEIVMQQLNSQGLFNIIKSKMKIFIIPLISINEENSTRKKILKVLYEN